MKIYKIASFSGEWWIIDGQSMFADGDIGDFNHEAYVINYAQEILMDGESEDWEEWKHQKASSLYYHIEETFDEDEKYYEKEKSQNDPEVFILDNIEHCGFDDEIFFIANGNHSDVRLFSMKEWGWKRMAGTEITTWLLTSEDLNDISNGIDDAYGEEIYDMRERGEEPDFNIEVLSTKQTYWNVPYEAICKGNLMALREYGRNNAFGPQLASSNTKVASINYQDIYQPGDLIEITADIYDYDNGDLIAKKGTKAEVSGLNNPEHINCKLEDGTFFSCYVLNCRKIWKDEFVKGDRVEAQKDIYDQLDHKVIVPRGTKGVVDSNKGKEWVKVMFENDSNNNPTGCHSSELKKIEKKRITAQVADLDLTGDVIFGIFNETDGVDSKVVPEQYAKTYGEKRGINHLDIFGPDAVMRSGNWTWRADMSGKVIWYAEPEIWMEHKVEDHLSRLYHINSFRHVAH